MQLTIDIVSDLICPWCFIGKRRLEKALADFPTQLAPKITWKPFQLNPDMPKDGMNRRAYREAKFGSWEASQRLDARVAEAGAGEGIEFSFDNTERTPNTLDAHRLIWLAQRRNVQDSIVERLFKDYFVRGKDIGRGDILLSAGVGCGLDEKDVAGFLESADGLAEITDEEQTMRRLGITSVPNFILNSEFSVSGAQEPRVFISAITQVLSYKG